MPNRTLLKAGLTVGVLCSSIAAVPAVAQAQLKTRVSIDKKFDTKGNVIFSGVVGVKQGGTAKERIACRRGRKVTLYRTVDTGFGNNTKKVATDTTATSGSPIGEWEIQTRRSGKYVAKVAATGACAAGESKAINYTRNLNG